MKKGIEHINRWKQGYNIRRSKLLLWREASGKMKSLEIFLENWNRLRWHHQEQKIIPCPCGWNKDGVIADRRKCHCWHDQCRSRRQMEHSPWFDYRHLVKIINKVLWTEQVRSDSSTQIPPAETWFVLWFTITTSEGHVAAASRGRISWNCGSDAPQRSVQIEVCPADMQEGRPASHYHRPAMKWPATQWATARRVDWLINWRCVLVTEQQNSRKQFTWCACSSTGLSQDYCADFEQTREAKQCLSPPSRLYNVWAHTQRVFRRIHIPTSSINADMWLWHMKGHINMLFETSHEWLKSHIIIIYYEDRW